MNDERTTDLANLGGGLVLELGNHELQKVFDNICDINTDAKATRELTIKIKLKPDERRNFAVTSVQATAKLAPIKPADTQLFIATKNGRAYASEREPRQLEIPAGTIEQDDDAAHS